MKSRTNSCDKTQAIQNIDIDIREDERFGIDLPDLWAALEIRQPFYNWAEIRLNEFTEDEDFVAFQYVQPRISDVFPGLTYAVSIDTAKKIAMMEETTIGGEVHRWLVEQERAIAVLAKSVSPLAVATAEGSPATMSSMELAELTGMDHPSLMRDIRAILGEAGIDPHEYTGTYKDTQNEDELCFRLPRLECDLVVLGYEEKHRMAVAGRWREKSELAETASIDNNAEVRTTLAIFNSSEFGDIRTVMEDGKPLFCAKDVAVALGYTNASKAIGDYCKGVTKRYLFTSTDKKELSFIPESDVYRLVMRSKLPGAVRFQDWVVEEVLPTIRKTGRFEIAPAPPQNMGEALRMAADLWRCNEAQALENTEHRRT